mgnify:FL=1
MKISLMLESQENLSWDALKRIAELIDNTKFYGLFLSDHLFSVKGTSDSFGLPVWPAMTAISIWTHSLRFGPLVNSITFRHPAQVAKIGESLQSLSDGRLELGLGAGWYSDEHEMFGVKLPENNERLNLLEEYIQIIKGLWTVDDFSFEGHHFEIKNASMNPKPTTNIPLIVGGMASRTIEIATKFGDQWNGYYLEHDKLKKKLDLIKIFEDRFEKSIKKTIMIPFVIEDSNNNISNHLSNCNKVFSNLPEHIEEWQNLGFLGGNSQEIVEQIQEYKEMGIDHIILEHLDIENDYSLNNLKENVLTHV